MADNVPKTIKAEGIQMAQWATGLLIVFMLFIPFLRSIDPSGILLYFLKEWLPVVLLLYMTVEVYETSQRSWTSPKGLIVDNTLAFAALVVGIVQFVLWFARPTFVLSYEQFHLLFVCTAATAFDFFLGIVVAFRIASSHREREEHQATH